MASKHNSRLWQIKEEKLVALYRTYVIRKQRELDCGFAV
jgi:hypothetical protein